MFSPQTIQTLLDYCKFNHKIYLLPNTTPLFGLVYTCSSFEHKAMKNWLDKNSMEGKIRKSNLLRASPCLLITKRDGSLRVCDNYREMNKITVKDRYLLSSMDELRDRLEIARDLIKCNLKNYFHLRWLREGDKWKATFPTRYSVHNEIWSSHIAGDAISALQCPVRLSGDDKCDIS